MHSKTRPETARRVPPQAATSARHPRRYTRRDGGALTMLARLANVALMLFIGIGAMVKIAARRPELAAQGESTLGLYLVGLLLAALFLSPHIVALAGLAKTATKQATSRALIYNVIALAAALVVTVATQDRQSIARGDWLILLPWLMVYGVNIFLLYKRGAQLALEGRIVVDVSYPTVGGLICNEILDGYEVQSEVAEEVADQAGDA